MHADTIQALHKKFVGDNPKPEDDEEMEDVTSSRDDEELIGMANMHRTGKALQRQNERNAMSARMQRRNDPRYFQVANGIHDAEAEGMVLPTHNYRKR